MYKNPFMSFKHWKDSEGDLTQHLSQNSSTKPRSREEHLGLYFHLPLPGGRDSLPVFLGPHQLLEDLLSMEPTYLPIILCQQVPLLPFTSALLVGIEHTFLVAALNIVQRKR